MEQILFAGILAFFTTLFVIPKIIYVSEKKKLFDNPDDVRKLHEKPTSSLGGLGIFVGFILSVLFSESFYYVHEFQFYIAAFLIIFFIGIKDDVVELTVVKKLIGQALVAAILMCKGHLLITNLQGFLGLTQINTSFSYFLTFFTILIIINAFNLIDGVDGLAGTLGFISSAVFGAFFFVNNDLPYAILSFGFAASLLAFLVFNFQPAKIFMGDTGSLLIGVVSSVLVIRFIQTGTLFSVCPVSAAPAVGFFILVLPLMDTLRLFGTRILNGRSPFSPDRNHIHHLLLHKGFAHKHVTFICAVISLVFIIAAFLLQRIGTNWLISAGVCSYMGCMYAIKKIPGETLMKLIKSGATKQLKSKGTAYISMETAL